MAFLQSNGNEGWDQLKQWVGRRLDGLLGVETAGCVGVSELGYDPAERVGYGASRWLALASVLPRREVTDADVFVDLGSGKGRVVLQAARHYQFSKVIGVEVSPELSAVATANLRAVQHRLRCPRVELVTADAAEWIPPQDLTIAYMFNPFRAHVFSRVIARLIELVDHRGWPLRLIYINPTEHELLAETGRAVQMPPPASARLRLAGLPSGWVNRYELRPNDNGRAHA